MSLFRISKCYSGSRQKFATFSHKNNIKFSRSYPSSLSSQYTPLSRSAKFSTSVKEQQTIPFFNHIFAKIEKASITVQPNSTLDIVSSDLVQLKQNIVKLLTTDHPFLKMVAQYYLDLKGKRFRPMVILLLSRAMESHRTKQKTSTILPKQLQLAEIIEMIHTASLIHDDVIDESTTRRGVPAINHQFTNKLAILAGDYLLARASVSLSWLENHQVTRLISTVIADLVEGEFMQLKPNPTSSSIFEYYLRKTYLKTASLIANGCTAAAILANESPQIIKLATDYGTNLGLAFQIVDDLLDFTASSESLGKPAAVDLRLGLATAPVLYAMQEYPELTTLVARKFSEPGDVQKAQQLVYASKGIERSKQLAATYFNTAITAIMQLDQSVAREALISLTHSLQDRVQ